MKLPLTDRQLQVIIYIKEYIHAEGMPPTRNEIAVNFGFKSQNSVQDHLMALERKGYITMRTGAARAIKVLP